VEPAAERIVQTLTERYGLPAATQRTSGELPTADWLFFITDPTANRTPPVNWSPEVNAFLNRPAITTDTTPNSLTVAPRGSKDGVSWWWTIAPEATFTLHPVSNSAPLTSISGGIRIPECATSDTETVTLNLDSGEVVILKANKRTTTNFTLELKSPTPVGTATTLTVISNSEGCQLPNFGYPQFVQVIDLVANPLLTEIDLITAARDSENTIIAIDDARGMGTQPDWPAMSEVAAPLEAAGFTSVYLDDIFLAVPQTLRKDLWNLYQETRMVEATAVFHIWPSVLRDGRARTAINAVVEQLPWRK
jgi:hypothetical protein